MDELNTSLDPDELMDLEEAEASEIDEDEEDNIIIEDPLPSPLQLPSSGPASAATSVASSPPTNEDGPPPMFTGKPLSIKRGRGRPRREGCKPQRRSLTGPRGRRWRLPGQTRGGPKRVRSIERSDFDFSALSQSPSDELMLDPETGALILSERIDRPLPPMHEELPYPPENWPGKVCGFCNLGERSQLGQGELLRLTTPEGFRPEKIASEQPIMIQSDHIQESVGDKSPRGPVTCRRQKSFNKCRNPSMTSEYVDELTIIGHLEEPDIQNIFESTGHFYVHRSCAYWANGVIKREHMGLENVGLSLLHSLSRKCNHCNHLGASIMCKMAGCTKIYHFPCATASGAFQELSTCTLYCSLHLSEVALHCESSVCYTCKTLGDIANLMYCSICGEHYHGTCVGLAQLPGVRAGWQCRKCRLCQTCRMIGDETKLMPCEQCDKVYHAMCQKPIVTSIPKYGWKCRCCRVCGDCGSRTPGAGLSSRWHSHYTVCDSCYQQRNKGFNCPICHRAYRAHAHREMVQCTMCRKFVHGTCDPDADLVTYHQRKEAHPEYDYVCLTCKNLTQGRQMVSKRNSIDEDSLSASQESLYDEIAEFDQTFGSDDSFRTMGLGKGKPFACKIAKKRFGFGTGYPGRPKGFGKGLPGKVGFMKRQKMTEFGRKRGPKYKMRGIFGVPGVGLQRPTSDGLKDEEPGVENRLVLCSAKDKYVLTQDICVMCGALGTDQEGCLIACVQCGQCYHPYCVNVKVTKVILQKGWRCLDCTVCEGCGHRDDESRLILCDDCDISYHIYCMDPPLHYVPHGNWKCKWCAMCQSCGSTDPGFNSNWMNSFSECGPCASHSTCASCLEAYGEGDLIIQCVQCERWIHGACDSIKSEADAEKCAEEGYNCILCRPRDVPPPHLLPTPTPKPPTPTKSPEIRSNTHYYLDGVYLSENGHNLIKSLYSEQSVPRKKRKKLGNLIPHDKDAGIMATIESVIAGSSSVDNSLEDAKLELVDVKDEPQEIYKEGMTWTKEDGPPPEGFTLFSTENGLTVLRRKRQRNLQKLGIGGFLVRMRGIRSGQDNDDVDMLPGQTGPMDPLGPPSVLGDADKPRRKPIRRKPKSKLSETFPSYLQEAFFGKELLDCHKELGSSSSDDERAQGDKDKSILLSQDELKAVAAVTAKKEVNVQDNNQLGNKNRSRCVVAPLIPKEEDDSDGDLKNVLTLPNDLLDTDIVNTIMNEDDDLTKNADTLESLGDESDITDSLGNSNNSKETKDELSDILGSHFNLDIPNMNSKDVEDIFKGVLTDESQESQESNIFPISNSNVFPTNTVTQIPQSPITQNVAPIVRPTSLPTVNPNSLSSPMSFPPQSPYQSDYSSPQFSPAISGPPSPWVNVSEQGDLDNPGSVVPSTYNQRSSEKMKADEGLGSGATISAVLYANMNHPDWKTEYPAWSDRYKQIIKKWRTLSNEQKAPYLQQAKDNRSALRMKKQQQINKESSASPHSTVSKATVPSPVQSAPPPQPVSEDQEKIAQQQKTAREAEQERQWKQLQAMRQQQAQQQQNVIQEQRVQGMGTIVRVQRQLSEGGNPQFLQDQLQVTTQQQDQTSSPLLTHSTQVENSFAQQNQNNTIRLTTDPYANQPLTPRPNIITVRPPIQNFQVRPEAPEVHRQLRDLLQKQQFKKLDDQLLPGKGQQRVWPPNDNTEQEQQSNITPATTGDVTFRQPLPPTIRQRLLTPPGGGILRQPVSGIRMQLDSRMQGLDPRMRLILQQQQQRGVLSASLQQFQQQQQQQQQQQPRFQQPQQTIRASSTTEIDQLLQRSSIPFQQRQEQVMGPRMLSSPAPRVAPPNIAAPPPATNNQPESADQEIPDNVTAELEKLEQEGPMAVLQSVSDIFSGIVDEDDELLAEMGADFNILEYADPELDALTEGEKTNILDSLDLVEPEPVKDVKKDNKQGVLPKNPPPAKGPAQTQFKAAPELGCERIQSVTSTAQQSLQPPPLVVSQPQVIHHQVQSGQPNQQTVVTSQLSTQLHQQQQQIHQQMLQQVQQVAAIGRPMPPGTRLLSQEGVIGTVTPNNNVSLSFPQNYQRLLQLQNQKMQMRLTNITQNPRMVPPGLLQKPSVGVAQRLQMPAVGPPPPPPPYPGPPPPYPGVNPQQQPQEQPLLLEELLEQEKREQEKQMQTQSSSQDNSSNAPAGSEMLSEHDFERLLKTDLISNTSTILGNNQVTLNQGVLPINQQRQGFIPQSPNNSSQQQWQQQSPRPPSTPTPQPQQDLTPKVPTFQANLLPTPPLPPEVVITEQDKQAKNVYEQWLNNQNAILTQQLTFYETEVQKLRKIRKSLNSKQRQLRKSGNQLGEADAGELQRISQESSILQKHLETSRKQSKQHRMLIQVYMKDYQNKQQPKPVQLVGQQSPLGPPASSPIHPPQSPMMSPSASPMMQHSSPLHSPAPSVSHSPGPGSVSSVLQSPGNPINQVMSPMQPSPRIGTPHSQSEGSPGPIQSPSMHLPPPMRMTSPQHHKGRIVTSPIGYITDMRPGTPQARFTRPQLERTRLQSPSPNFQSKPGTPSPLNSPPPQQISQQLLPRHLQQIFLQQQQQQLQQSPDGNEGITNSQRTMQLIQQRQFILRQQGVNQPQPLTSQQNQLMIQQQQQLAKQQQQQIAQLQVQQRLQQNALPRSPMPPQSPHLVQQQIMSPHSMQSQPPSPMPPRSPMLNFSNQPPSSPMPRSPAIHHHNPTSPMIHQPPSPMLGPKSPMVAPNQSPMSIRRPPSTSPMTDPISSKSFNLSDIISENEMSGGGNPHNNPIPAPPEFGKYGYFKLGLRGGAPMWSGFGRGAKRMPEVKVDESKSNDTLVQKYKKEPHLSKVSILKKKSPAKLPMSNYSRLGSLVSSDYNELDDSSSTPPVTPPPTASTSRVTHKSLEVMLPQEIDQKDQVMLMASSSGKQLPNEIMDYDDDNLIATEVSLNSAAQTNDVDEITSIQSFNQNELPDGLSSPLESDQLTDEFVLFGMAEGVQYSDKDVEEEEEEYGKDMHIVNVAIQSPTPSEEEMIIQGKTKKVSSDSLTLNIVQGLSSDHLLSVSDTPDSPDEEMQVDNNESPEDEQYHQNSQIVILGGNKSEEHISTKEDFEELIDGGSTSTITSNSKNEKVMKPDPKHINEIHKYAANVFNFPPKTSAGIIQTIVKPNVVSFKGAPPKMTFITTPFVTNNLKAKKEMVVTTNKVNSSVASIILPIKNSPMTARNNIINVPKLVSSGSPAITIVTASTSQIASILPSRITVPVISASAVSKLPNVKVIDKPTSSLSLSAHQEMCLPKKIFEDDSVSPDSSNTEDEKKSDSPGASPEPKKTDHKLEKVNVKEHGQIIRKTSSPMVIHNTPELKMTAQVIQETQAGVEISRTVENMPFIMNQSIENVDGADDNKSVVISIPSPTPSQEQILDNIALQALENRRRDGIGMHNEFETFEDVLDMIENITGEPGSASKTRDPVKPPASSPVVVTKIETPVTVSTSSRATIMPQLSPLSQPTELTTNMANVSQQLRTLLSNLHTTTVTTNSNIETVVKSVTKEKIIPMSASSSVVTSRVFHQNAGRSSPVSTTNNSSVIVKKPVCSPKLNQSVVSSSTTHVSTSNNLHPTLSSLLPGKSSSGIQLMPDHPKLPPVTTNIATSIQMSLASRIAASKASSVITSQLNSLQSLRKPSLSLNQMLQSHPAATTQTSPGTITTASILGSPIAITRPSLASLAQAQPTVMSPLVSSNTSTNPTSSSFILSNSLSQPVTSAFARTTTNLLHTQLTKSPIVRHKSLDEDKKEFEIKTEQQNENQNDSITTSNLLKQETKFTHHTNRMEDSQNVLLKQLLQNTACATTPQSTTTNNAGSTTSTSTPTQTAPSLPIVPNLEAQLARPVPPTPTSLLPPILQNDSPVSQANKIQKVPIRETSFVSKPMQPTTQTNTLSSQQQQLHIDVKKGLPPSRTPSRDDLLSPATPRSSCSQESSLQTPPLIIKKEPLPQQSPVLLTSHEVKKEFVDETSQHSEVSDQSKSEVMMKEEMDFLDSDKVNMEKEEMKKIKRRAYQAKRRQNQILNKESAGQPKKRPRKSSKVDEDYDAYMESVLAQLRSLPPMIVSEPQLNKNFGVVPVYGSSDLSKVGTAEYDARCGDLIGTYGNARVPGFTDFYSTKPYGDFDPLPEKPPTSTQRGFYDQEFPLIKFDTEEDKKFDLFCREDTPDSIVSSSSPECPVDEPPLKFPGLRLIDEDLDEDEVVTTGRLSPVVNIIAPIPIKLKPHGPYLKDYADVDKENIYNEPVLTKSKFGSTSNIPLKDSGNVTVTLTLTSSAAEDIMGVLRDLANILHIPAPTSYQIVERTKTPPSQKLGLYRTKGKDGKEGAPIDIQSILNGAAKFCRHCDVVILNNMIRKKVSELPFLSKDSELLSDGDELFFCSSTCYMQFALMHRSPSLSEDKALAIINHLCMKDKMEEFKRKSLFDNPLDKIYSEDRRKTIHSERMDIDYTLKHMKTEKMQIDQPIKVEETPKVWKNIRYKTYTPNCIQPANKYKKPTDKEIMELMYRLRVTIMPNRIPEDTRRCMFCLGAGDSMADGPARLLNFDVDKWVHLNCGLWSDGVYETVNGALMNLSNAVQQSLVSTCVLCNNLGATIRCFKTRCTNFYHLPCAVKDKCVFYKNKTTYCSIHVPKNEKDNELTTLSVSRRVYVDRDENRQVAAVMHHSDQNNLLRVGSLIFLNVGQLLPHQLANFHTSNYIFPIGYKIVRFYWSMRKINKRCCYVCSIHEVMGRPEFRIIVQEADQEDIEYRDLSCKAVWLKVLQPLDLLRREQNCIRVFPQFVSGEDLFGLTEPAVVRVLESLPGIETLSDYKFKYGRNPLLELPLAINPSGAARTEPKLKNQLHWKRPHTQRTSGSTARPVFTPTNPTTSGEAACPYSKQFVHSKSSQYKKMKQEWRNNVYLARSKIQGLGLYAARDLEKHTMVIEYIGEIIRSELAETREKKYEARNRGIYMFRLDEERVIDATLCGGLARYINHSCNPNCVAEVVEVDRDVRIIIFSKRRIQRGEELSYDYKFDIEDDQHKISCMCGAPNCKKWMN